MNILRVARDNLTNLVSRIGTERDKAASSNFVFTQLYPAHCRPDPRRLSLGLVALEDR